MNDDKRINFLENLGEVFTKHKLHNKFNLQDIRNFFLNKQYPELKSTLQDIRKILFLKLKLEEKLFQMDSIAGSVETRLEYLESDKGKMLNSILKREQRLITIDQLLIDPNTNTEELIFDKDKILEHTKNHYAK